MTTAPRLNSRLSLLASRRRAIRRIIGSCAIVLGLVSSTSAAGEVASGRKSLVLENQAARLVVDLGGGSLGEFKFRTGELNPLSWNSPVPGDASIHGFGHFLCLDRWGPPSEAEGAHGMPYHGEAAHVPWEIVRGAGVRDGLMEAELRAVLPKAGLSVRRTIRMSEKGAVCAVREEVRNENPLGRIYNMVQHPTIGPPFLDETTLVDCNGRKGFAQGGSLPNPEEPSFFWPQALTTDGEGVNMRRLTNKPEPNVVSYSIDASYGWVTAATPPKGLLIGYLWRTKDYPWVSLWRDVREGRPAARGLEFGTTGLHQPFATLVEKGRIWNRPLLEYLDSGAAVVKTYLVFLVSIPNDFGGVESIEVEKDQLSLNERGREKPRIFRVEAEGLIPK
jgi:hypothetical protein